MPRPGPSFRTSLLPMVVADDERRYVAANPAACLLLRLPEEEVLRLRVDDLTPPEAREGMDELWAVFLREGTQRGRFELHMPDRARLAVEYCATAHIEPGRHLVHEIGDGLHVKRGGESHVCQDDRRMGMG